MYCGTAVTLPPPAGIAACQTVLRSSPHSWDAASREKARQIVLQPTPPSTAGMQPARKPAQ